MYLVQNNPEKPVPVLYFTPVDYRVSFECPDSSIPPPPPPPKKRFIKIGMTQSQFIYTFEATFSPLNLTYNWLKGLLGSLVPRPHPAFVACSTEKRGEPGIFSHVSDVTTNEKLMNVGGLKHNGVIAHALIVPAKMVREFVCLMPSNRALLLPCRVYVFANG